MDDWTEKYRPKTLDEVVGNERALNALRQWANSWKTGKPKKRAVILAGKPGIGKTSSALALANEYRWTPIELNTSDARNAVKIKKVATSGAVNETFTDDGRFISSQTGGRKLIILDEADNLYEKTTGSNQGSEDLSDRGGKKAIIDTIKITNQPIILIVNDYYKLIRGAGEVLKNICQLIRFYEPYPSSIIRFLKRICASEGIFADQKVLQNIADRCKGDIRSAVNDLQSISLDKKQVDTTALSALGYRDREKDIFAVLREIFKTSNIQSIRESVSRLDLEPGLLLLWITENLPREYLDLEDMYKAYEYVSKADVFLGRTYRRQHFGLWAYACDYMNGGVAVAKTHSYPNDSYSFPTWLRERKMDRTGENVKESLFSKISKITHSSNKKTKEMIYPFFKNMFCNNTPFAIEMKNKLNLSESEIKYLLGKNHSYKLKEILLSPSELEAAKKIEPEEKTVEENEKEEEIQQHSLFDF